MVRVAGRDRLGYRRHGQPVGLAEQIGRAMRVPSWAVYPARRRLTLRRLADRRQARAGRDGARVAGQRRPR